MSFNVNVMPSRRLNFLASAHIKEFLAKYWSAVLFNSDPNTNKHRKRMTVNEPYELSLCAQTQSFFALT